MLIGVPTEVKNRESRVALTPAGVHSLVGRGHEVVIQAGAGNGSSFLDADYVEQGARIGTVEEAWGAELVLKVKEPVPDEYRFLAGQTLFTFLHLAANASLAQALVDAGTTAISYDTVQLPDGSLPLLIPMSEVAGRLAVLAGAYHLLSSQGGRGVLLAGVPGTPSGKVTVIGAGIAGGHAVEQAVASGADVTVLDVNMPRLRDLDNEYGGRVHTLVSTPHAVEQSVLDADLVIGAVLIPGRAAPKVVTSEMVLNMKNGAVLVDIAIDQGGCFEDSKPTTHDDPVYTVGRTTFYCVANMPGAVGLTATQALANATLPYVLKLADGVQQALMAESALAAGLSVSDGKLRHSAAIEAFPDLPA